MKIEITELPRISDSLDYEVRSGDNFCRFSISGCQVSTDLEELKAEIVYAATKELYKLVYRKSTEGKK